MAEVEIVTGTVDSIDLKSKNGSVLVTLANQDGGQYPLSCDPLWPPGEWICFPEPGDTVDVIMPAGDDIVEHPGDVRYIGKRRDPDSDPVPSEFKTNYPYRRGFKTKAGHILIVDDKAGTIELTNGSSGDSVTMSKTGATVVDGKTSVTVNSPSVKLGSSAAVEAVIKGTTFVLNFSALISGWNTALGNLSSGGGTPAAVIAYATAVQALITTLTPLIPLWPSLVSKTD